MMINEFKVIVSGFVKNDQEQLLVIRRSDDEESFPGMFAIPGGTIEVTETGNLEHDTVEKNLEREIFEETNIQVRVTEWIESTALAKNGKAKLYLFFTCEAIDAATPLKTSAETPEVFWADITTLDLENCTPTLKKYIEAKLSSKN